jgi:sn-glycerol 3-phosphate transport system substrate-binding protein
MTVRRYGDAMRRQRPSGRSMLALVVVSALGASCSNGRSILDAGNERPSVTVPPTAPPGETLPPTVPPTTVPTKLDTLPPCKPAALDDATGPVELTFWHGLSNETKTELERQTAEFNSSQNRIRVNLEFQGSYEITIDKYLQSNLGNRPDLVQTPEYALQLMIDTESTVPVQACIEAAKYDTSPFLPAVLNAYSAEGVLWTMPYNVSNPVLYYHRGVFQDAGLDPEQPPRTLAEVAEFGRQIQQSGAASYGLAVDSPPDGGGGWFLEQWLGKEGALYCDNSNGRDAPSTRVLWDQGPAEKILTELRDVVTDGAGIYVGENPGGADTLLKLADQAAPASMAISTSASLGTVLAFVGSDSVPGISDEDIGIGPMPSPSGQLGVNVGGASLWIVDKGDDIKAAAAWEYITFLDSAQQQSEWAAATGYVPLRTDALELDPIKTVYTDDPRFKVAYDQLLASSDSDLASGPVLGPLREVRVFAAEAMGAIIQGADPAQTLTAAAAEANSLIADYNARR